MSNEFTIDPESIKRSAGDLETAADNLDQALGDFTQSLSSIVEPWGEDTLGQLIGGGYAAIEELALDTYNSIVTGFDDFVDGLENMADTYSGAEQQNTGDIKSTDTQA